MSVTELATTLKNAVDEHINREARALRGIIKNGMFCCGARTYPFKQAVDCSLKGKVWAQLDKNGRAIIIGA